MTKEREPHYLGELLYVALPLVISSGSVTLMFVTDRLFLSWLSKDALAAALPAGMMHWTLLSLPFGIAGYVNAIVAQYDGAGKHARVVSAVWQGLYFSLLVGLLAIFLAPFSAAMFSAFGHRGPMFDLEVPYFRILCFGTAPFVIAQALAGFYSGRGQTLVIMWANIIACLANILLDYGLIFGRWGMPEWGMEGAAIATVTSQAIAVGFYLCAMLLTSTRREYELLRYWQWDRDLFGRLLRFGVPAGVHTFLESICFAVFVVLVGKMGTDAMAATNLAFNLNSMVFVPMLGLGTAVMTIVGRRIGEGRPELATRTTWLAFALTGTYTGAFGLLYLLAPDLLLAPYAWQMSEVEFPILRAEVVVLLRFVAVYSLFDAMAIIFGAAVRGAGDVKYPLYLTVAAGWICAVLPTWLADLFWGGSLFIAWCGVTAYVSVIGLGLLWRFQGGKWQSMRVIESFDDDTSDSSTIESSHPIRSNSLNDPQNTHDTDEIDTSMPRVAP